MDKSRVAAFTDAVVAIIMTIMVLEFKTPETYNWSGILDEGTYFFAYAISFLFILVAWYNHHYMFALAPRITKRIFWINNAWLFSMSIIPVSTAWVGKFMMNKAPEYFYLIIFLFWSLAYESLTKEIIKASKASGHKEIAKKIASMPPYRLLNSWRSLILYAVVLVMIQYFPPMGLLVTLAELLYMAFHTTDDSDQIA
ncbi:TMEM175 family protein [Lentilactobacillus sp. SPB1-3]|uniref:TMEM175 family protein n=1 Tax=Lentilactobacillus terminaliae TaxID=3003483 RepID=A0ACD5DF02_9LACO|nr:TMEM175 family protein [Lentilactobacillus sp. SPB1-3]MCZ0976479.1 TMEM175 family protein [Lentilactobacillus sp. SPB1-3]